MPTTERWIKWSKDFAKPYKQINYQLYLEVAQGACRFQRDSRGLSTVPELANADHYWLARYLVFLSAGAGGDATDAVVPDPALILALTPGVVGIGDTTGAFIPNLPSGAAEFQRYMGGFITGAVAAYAIVPIMTIAWDVWKRVDPRPTPIGDPPASAPSADQMMWALRGCNIGFVKDAEHIDQMIWGFAVNRFIQGNNLIYPAPPT
jgi:hypothetical protein